MKNFLRKEPWSVSTVTMIAIIFTPLVGGIVAAINQQRLGFPRRAKKGYALAFLSLLAYALYFTIMPGYVFALFLPPLAVIYATVIILLVALEELGLPFLLLIVFPSLFIIRTLSSDVRIAWRSQTIQYKASTWWEAYATAIILTPVMGFLLFALVFVLSRSELVCLYFLSLLDMC